MRPRLSPVTGIDDDIVDGDVNYMIVLATASSADPDYQLDPADVSVVNRDAGDQVGISVMPTAGLVTNENGRTVSFDVVLDSEPTADVEIDVMSTDTTEGVVDTTQLMFTPVNWNVPQSVNITGQDDNIADGDVPYSIVLSAAVSADPNYSGIDPADVSVVNANRGDQLEIIVNGATNLITTEAGGQDTFSVRLGSQPSSSVTVPVMSLNSREGLAMPMVLTFDSSNWDQPQIVTLTGQPDDIADGDVSYQVEIGPASSPEGEFGAVFVDATNQDDGDAVGLALDPAGGLVTTETGGVATFTVALTSEPTAEVTVPVSSSDSSEGEVDVSNVTFLPSNWNVPQTITVTGRDDSLNDDSVNYTIGLGQPISADPMYAALPVQNVSVTNEDDDSPGLVVDAPARLETSEDLTTATFTVALMSEPFFPVTVFVSSSNIAEGTGTPAQLQFDASNWNQPQTITVTGVDDSVTDGPVDYQVQLSSSSTDGDYDGLSAAVDATNLDNDIPGVSILPGALETNEAGAPQQFSVRLTTQPTADVRFDLASFDNTEGTISIAQLTFTSANWDLPQTVSVMPQDDNVADGNVSFLIVTGATSSDDSEYDGLDVPDVTVTNLDDDVPGISAIPLADPRVAETGSSVTYEVQLTSQPLEDVIFAVSSSDTGEGVASLSTLTFTSANWNLPQTVTVSGVDDEFVDGDREFALQFDPTSADPIYDNLSTTSFALQNEDDDTASISIVPRQTALIEGTLPNPVTEFVFDVSLTGQVEGGFDLGYATSEGTATDDDYVAADDIVTFTGSPGETTQLAVLLMADATVEPDEQFEFALGSVLGVDPSLANNITVDTTPIALTILNDDTATVTIVDASANEGTASSPTLFSFDVTLSAGVQGGLQVAYMTADGSATVADADFQALAGQLQFAGTPGETQMITVSVSADSRVERDEVFQVLLGAITDAVGQPLPDVSVAGNGEATGMIVNDDTATISFVDPASLVPENIGTASIPVRLNVSNSGTLSEDVVVEVITLPSSTATMPDDYTLLQNTITFPAGSVDGATQNLDMVVVLDQVLEDVETVLLQLNLVLGDENDADIGGAVTIGGPAEHQVEIVDDPMTGQLSGRVFDDEDRDGIQDSGEEGIAGVTISLSGIDVFQMPVERETTTDATGFYQFTGLPIGVYEVSALQPSGFIDGVEYLGTVEGQPSGVVGDDRMFDIVLGP